MGWPSQQRQLALQRAVGDTGLEGQSAHTPARDAVLLRPQCEVEQQRDIRFGVSVLLRRFALIRQTVQALLTQVLTPISDSGGGTSTHGASRIEHHFRRAESWLRDVPTRAAGYATRRCSSDRPTLLPSIPSDAPRLCMRDRRALEIAKLLLVELESAVASLETPH
jgi:hypothetical protein